jgi:hypothetical protein
MAAMAAVHNAWLMPDAGGAGTMSTAMNGNVACVPAVTYLGPKRRTQIAAATAAVPLAQRT